MRSQAHTRRRFALLAAAVLASLTFATALPAPAAAATATSAQMASMTLAKINAGRTAKGLVPYRGWGALNTLAQERAQRMADKMTLSHTVAGGNVGTALTARGLQWYSYGEIIGMTTYPWGSQSVSDIYARWKASSFHRSLMFSSTFNYAGVGVARASNGSTWISVVFTESRDHTIPVAQNGTLTRSGTSLSFTWSGFDRRLQTHTAGLRSFDLQYRVDNGTWRTIRNDTTSRSIVLSGRAHGHYYAFRVQSADRRGNLSRWTAAIRIWVP